MTFFDNHAQLFLERFQNMCVKEIVFKISVRIWGHDVWHEFFSKGIFSRVKMWHVRIILKSQEISIPEK